MRESEEYRFTEAFDAEPSRSEITAGIARSVGPI